MTAINVFCRGRAVHLLTDGAYLSPDGVLRLIGPKVRTLPHLNAMAIMRGPFDLESAFVNALGTAMTSFDHLLANFESAVNTIADAHAAANGFESFDLVVAGVSEFYQMPKVIGAFCGETAGTNRTVVQSLSDWTAPMTAGIRARLAARGIDPESPSFDPERDGLTLLEEQRREVIQPQGWPAIHIVGGFAQLTTLTTDGITTRVLKRWPDKVNEKISP